MNLIITFLFASVFYIRSLKNFFFHKYLNKQNLLAKKKDDLYSGFDCRHNYTGIVNTSQLHDFAEHLKKLYIINILNDESISPYTKINIIKNYSNHGNNYASNLYAGGLLNDFHLFELE
jgi:hypothetical protein